MCIITINPIVQGHESTPGAGIDRITISGTATQCDGNLVSIVVHQTTPVNVDLTREAEVDSEGNWSVDFSIALGDFSAGAFVCGLGNKYDINASCLNDPQCAAPHYTDTLVTCDGDDTNCPVPTVREISREPCDNGVQNVTFAISVINPSNPTVLEIDYGDTTDENIVLEGADNASPSHLYTSGTGTETYEVVVRIVFPLGCPSFDSIPVVVDCPTPSSDCPSVSVRLADDQSDSSPCEKRFEITVSNAPNPTLLFIDYGDGILDDSVEGNNSIPYSEIVASGGDPIRRTHTYDHTGTYTVVVNIEHPEGCLSEPLKEPVVVDCPTDCLVRQVTLVIENIDGTPESVECIPAGQYEIKIVTDPPNVITPTEPSTIPVLWFIDGQPAAGEGRIVEIARDHLTINIDATSDPTTVSVAVGEDECLLTDGIDLRPCIEPCCPTLDGLTANCMTRCPESTLVTLTATGQNLECAEAFLWEFGDGTTIETNGPTTTHPYPRLSQFEAAVIMFRPENCGRERTARSTFLVEPCSINCQCINLTIAFALLAIVNLALIPLVACSPNNPILPLVQAGVGIALLVVFLMLWFDPCCRLTKCENYRIGYWIFTWALAVATAITFLQFCVSSIPLATAYLLLQQFFLRKINEEGCIPGAPDMFTWPFPACR